MPWRELEEKDEVDYCKCGKKFWIFWHGRIEGVKEVMKKCAPCYFGKGK